MYFVAVLQLFATFSAANLQLFAKYSKYLLQFFILGCLFNLPNSLTIQSIKLFLCADFWGVILLVHLIVNISILPYICSSIYQYLYLYVRAYCHIEIHLYDNPLIRQYLYMVILQYRF